MAIQIYYSIFLSQLQHTQSNAEVVAYVERVSEGTPDFAVRVSAWMRSRQEVEPRVERVLFEFMYQQHNTQYLSQFLSQCSHHWIEPHHLEHFSVTVVKVHQQNSDSDISYEVLSNRMNLFSDNSNVSVYDFL